MPYRIFSTFIAFVAAVLSASAQKPRITAQDQLPRFQYACTGRVTDLVTDEAAFAALASQVRADLEQLLVEFDIADRATLQTLLGTLMNLDLAEGRLDDALARLQQMRALEEKPAVKLTLGLLAETYIEARRAGDFSSEAAFRATFAGRYAAKLDELPWDTVADPIKSAKASAEITSAGLILGNLESSFQPGVDKTGSISGDVAQALIASRTNYALYLPLKAERIAALSAFVTRNFKAKPDRWSPRLVDLTGATNLTPVTLAVWDSGVDVAVFAGRLWQNAAEQANGADDDGNGYVDDVHGIAVDLHSQRTPHLLIPLDDAQRAAYPAMRNWTKGLEDLQAGVDSVEASDLKRQLSSLQAAEVKPFLEGIGFFGNFSHGTHVAGIAMEGNPAARLMPVRITFDHRLIPDTPTRARSEAFARAARESIGYMQEMGARVVNMSWSGDPKFLESALEANGAGGTPEERKATARELFQLFRAAMTEAIGAAPEVLFVAAAGNSNSDAGFDESIPASLDLPNILTVGAVDQAGEETSFSSFGKNVDVHANGFEVESFLPGGERIKFSGTSMASPNVANLAAKLIALEPRLTVEQTIMFIKLGAERSADGRINLINPKKSVALLRAWQQAN